ncbi:helix-turn-helix domain-containing protein [Amycolatopsis sp. WQ 127309]|uniref:helix-turn-helix domain-containing protein n=1 Tax=Amycolatopsis sp. WQ 127309 TaxID=2932773 RepID=UPI001FF38B33|nr:helix-turn-helix domain-containing protein [Amycolatopsis sp. WQ 127309]UOZ05572.1 helix-turn-helix domain-containing protein [Amycolatopsis sp. WQ 127309]
MIAISVTNPHQRTETGNHRFDKCSVSLQEFPLVKTWYSYRKSAGGDDGGQVQVTEASSGADSAGRASNLVALGRLSTGPRAVDAILDWLAGRTGGTVALLGVDGRAIAAPPGRPRPRPAIRTAVASAIADMQRRGTSSAVLGGEAGTIDLVCLGTVTDPPKSEAGTAGQAPYLIVTGWEDRRHGALLTDTCRILGLCWRLEEAERTLRRVASATAHSREAVLHLLMIGSLAAARRIAAALRPELSNLVYVYVVECPARQRHQVADRIERFARGRAWIVPCPVRPNHLIALVPPDPDDNLAGLSLRRVHLDQLIAENVPQSRIGASAEVPLRETAIGYEQAFHALAVARGVPGRYARFDRHTDLTPFIGGSGPAWAAGLLMPCLSHTPARRADPGAEELLATLNSWLAFDNGASRHLKIHRNTLSARLRLLDELLGLDLTHVADQSAAWLALRLHSVRRIHSPPPEADRTVTLDALLATPGAGVWARSRLHPLEWGGPSAGVETVRAWLRADTRLPATAAALGISGPATRKRLARVEQALGRSLLHAPSAKHELWLAMRALGSV